MRYVLLGTLNAEWAGRHAERVERATAKLAELGIKLESVHYTQGYVDFVDVVEAPSPEAILAFSVWYVKQGYGRFHSLPAFDDAAMQATLKRV
ncbi:MAG: GYD domain-containing protein [Geminicoccaceae bacterium]